MARYKDKVDAALLLVAAGADPTLRDHGGAKNVVANALSQESKQTKAAVEAAIAETTVASVLAWHPAPNRARVVAWLAAQARDRGLRDVALLRGTRLRVNKFDGEGEYTAWEKSRIGANDHFIRFPHGVEKVELKKIKPAQWSVLPETAAAASVEPEPEPEPEAPVPEGVPPTAGGGDAAAAFGMRCVDFDESDSGLLGPIRGLFDDEHNPRLSLEEAVKRALLHPMLLSHPEYVSPSAS